MKTGLLQTKNHFALSGCCSPTQKKQIDRANAGSNVNHNLANTMASKHSVVFMWLVCPRRLSPEFLFSTYNIKILPFSQRLYPYFPFPFFILRFLFFWHFFHFLLEANESTLFMLTKHVLTFTIPFFSIIHHFFFSFGGA